MPEPIPRQAVDGMINEVPRPLLHPGQEGLENLSEDRKAQRAPQHSKPAHRAAAPSLYLPTVSSKEGDRQGW